MKTKLLRDRKAGALTLQVTPGKHEALEYEQAEWLKASAGDRFCRFDYRRDGGPVLYYDLTGLVELRAYLRAAISSSQYQLLLSSLADVMGACTRQGYPTASLVCDPSLVYVDDSGAPRFVYVPLSGMAERAENTPLALLRHLASTRNVTFAVAGDEAHAAALDDFASRNLVLSLSAYRAFLSEEFGLAPGGSGSLGAAASPARAGASGQLGPSSGVLAGVPSRPAAPRGAVPSGGTSSPVAFDFVAMLNQAPSATQVRATQSVARQVRDAVAGHSPTAAPRPTAPAPEARAAAGSPVACAPSAAPPVPSGTPNLASVAGTRRCVSCGEELAPGADFCSNCGARVSAAVPLAPVASPAPPAPAPAPASVQPAGTVPHPEGVATGRATPTPASGGTTLLGSFSATAVAARAVAPTAPRQTWLERGSDGLRLRLPDDDRPVVVGRSASCDLQFSGNGNVSRRHVELRRATGGFEASDLGSANGTFVGGLRLAPGERILLVPGETLLLADEAFHVVEG